MELARILGYLLLTLLCCHSDAQVINIAKGGTADQSDTFGGLNATYGPQKANNEDYEDFSHTTDGPNKWWRLDLGSEHQIGRIELFNRPGNNTVHQYYERLKNICILTAINNSPNQHPSCNSPLWANRHNQTEPYGPVGIIRFNSPVTARYVAISKFNDGKNLALVEVEIYESDLPAPSLGLQIKSYVPSCVSLSWSNPTFDVGTINRYEYKCATGPSDDKYAHRWIEASNSQTTAKVCDFQPSTEVTCSVTAVVIGGASQQETLSILTSGNLAYRKTSNQSSNFSNDHIYRAPLAVNGIIDVDGDFTHTAKNEDRKWWSVDLGITRDIGRVELYNRRGNCGPAELCYNRLAKIYILISTEESPQNPILNMRHWTNESYQQEPYGPVGIIQFDEKVPARHVTVYSESADVLSLAEVEIYASTDLSRPLHLNVMNKSTDCVDLHWSSPEGIAGEVRRYEILCSKYKWTNLHQNLSHTVCGYLPYDSVTCSLIAVVRGGASQEDKGSTFTNCASPELPAINVEDNIGKEVVDDLGRKRWKYTITWARPSRVNCHGDLSYQYRIDGIPGDVLTEEIPVELYLDGGLAYNFTLVYMNSHGRSMESIISDTSNQLAPQFNNSDLHLTSSKSNCIVLTARSPQFPGGTLTSFQYWCTGKEWTDMQANIEGKEICGYQPYTEVTCSVRAQNSEHEKTISQTVYTLCEVPHEPEVVIGETEDERNGRKVWKYKASWTPPERVNCNGSLSYIYGINGTLDSGMTSNVSKVFYLDGYQLYNVTVLAVNSHGNSTLVTKSDRSGVIAPQFKPHNVKVIPKSTSCIELTWDPPQYPGGPDIKYEVTCNDDEPRTIESNTDLSEEVCDLDPYTRVNCKITANNSAGGSLVAEDTNYTLCAVPDPPNVSLNVTANYTGGLKVWKYAVSWDPPGRVNCNGSLSYIYGINGTLDSGITDDTSKVFYLDGYQLYNVTVLAVNSHGNSTLVTGSGRSDVIAPRFKPCNVKVTPKSTSCIELTWDPPQYPGGPNVTYEITCNNETSTKGLNMNLSEEICDLDPYTEVNCAITANNSAGGSLVAEDTNYTLCADPSQPEVNLSSLLRGDGENGTVAIIIDIEESKSNCRSLYEYTISIEKVADKDGSEHHSVNVSGEYEYLDFKPYTNYAVIVTAVNDERKTSQAVRKTILSAEKEPETPPTLERLESTESCVTISALKPSVTNGPIQYYQLDCISSESSMNKTVPAEDENGSAELCGFNSATRVTCSAVAINGAGDSPPVYDSTRTKIKVQPEDKPKISEPVDGSVPVQITKPKGLSPDITVSWYLLMLSPIKTVFKRSQTDECDEHFALNPKNFSSSTPGGCYVTAELSGKEVGDELVFNVGDDKTYGSYHNARLVENKKYNLYLAVAVEVEEQEGPLVKVMTPITLTGPEVVVKEQPNTTPAVPPTGMIVGGTVGGVAAAIAVIVILLFVRRRKRETAKHPPKDTELSTISSDGSSKRRASKYSAPSPPRPRPALPPVPCNGEQYQNLQQMTTVIQVRDLEMYVRNNVDHIYEQYKDLEKLPRPKMDIALKLENKGRCRYKGLYPSDEHRVILNRENEGSDFINASYIAGYSKDNAYIAAQGPTPVNINDFWYMIWQEQPSAIVMVTRAIENGKNKCEQYWPLDKDTVMKFGDISVSMKSMETWADFTQTHLTISKRDQSRSLSHFNYLSWPDHGVPDDLGSYIAFYTQVKSTISRSTRALLIHCSAGVGRTGTYIALEYLIQQAKKENIVDIFACVERMRKRRPCMVQTDDQYMFLHEVLAESLAVDGFKCSPSELQTKLCSHEQGRSRNQANSIVTEYQHLERRLAAMSFSYSIAQEDGHAAKNRFPDFLPCNKYMPYLSKAKGIYINAVLVDSYTQKNQWIATQLPLSNTITDFWQLVIEQNIGIIVQLESTEMPFYPMNDMATLSTSMHSLIRGGSEESGSIETIPLKVQTGSEEKSVHVIRLKAWNEGSQTFPSPEVLLALCGAVEELQKRINPAKICVTCLNGTTRCGLFICASNAIEKLKSEQDVNIYGPTAMAKIRRPQFISSIDEYAFLYKVLKSYTDSFAEYANFM